MQRTRSACWSLSVLSLVTSGCGGGNDDESPFTTGGTTVSDGSDGASTAGDSGGAVTGNDADDTAGTGVTGDATAGDDTAPDDSEEASTDDDDSTGPLLDVSAETGDSGSDTGESEICSAVDVLFMIDDSPSMGPYQQALAGAFPGFIDEIYAALPAGVDLHVGITTSNFSNGPCLGTAVCLIEGPSQDGYTPPGQGMVNANGAQGRLFEWDGQAYFAANTSDDPTPLKDWFTGAATAVGEGGCNKEKQSAGLAYATNPVNDPTNAGFLRDEGAVLLLFAISDEVDSSPESLATYTSMVLDAKSGCGGDTCVIAAGLVDPCAEAEDNILWQFLNAFGEPASTGDFADVAGYGDVIGEALAQAVLDTCTEIPPVD